MSVKDSVKQLRRELDHQEFVDEGTRWRVHDVIYDASLREHMVLYADVRCRYQPPRPEDLESSTVREVRAWIAASGGRGSAADVVPAVSPVSSPASSPAPSPVSSLVRMSDSASARAPALAPAPSPAPVLAPAPASSPAPSPAPAPAPAPSPAPSPAPASTARTDARTKRLDRLKRQLGDTLGVGDLYYRKFKQCVQSPDGTPTSTDEFRKRLYER